MNRSVVLMPPSSSSSAVVVGGVGADPAAAHHCGGDGDVGDNGGGASAWCHGDTPGQPPSGSGNAGSAIWNAYCGSDWNGEGDEFPWQEGYWVEFVFDFVVEDIEWILSLGHDPSGEYGAYVVICHAGEDGQWQWDWVVWEITPPVPPENLRDAAAARINPDPPSVETNPPFNERPAIVTLPTWLWINDPWEVITEEETQGLVTVTVTATPVVITWSMGDGGAAYCNGPGIPWSEAVDAAGTYCSYTYISSSADEAGAEYGATATLTWEFEWWINGAYQGVFGTLDLSTAFGVPVGEIQAVESNG